MQQPGHCVWVSSTAVHPTHCSTHSHKPGPQSNSMPFYPPSRPSTSSQNFSMTSSRVCRSGPATCPTCCQTTRRHLHCWHWCFCSCISRYVALVVLPAPPTSSLQHTDAACTARHARASDTVQDRAAAVLC